MAGSCGNRTKILQEARMVAWSSGGGAGSDMRNVDPAEGSRAGHGGEPKLQTL